MTKSKIHTVFVLEQPPQQRPQECQTLTLKCWDAGKVVLTNNTSEPQKSSWQHYQGNWFLNSLTLIHITIYTVVICYKMIYNLVLSINVT